MTKKRPHTDTTLKLPSDDTATVKAPLTLINQMSGSGLRLVKKGADQP